jgi:hypothetical protein
MTATARDYPEVAALLAREAAGEELEFADWARAIAAWYTHGWTTQQWEEWAEVGFTEASLERADEAIRALGLHIGDMFEPLYWAMVVRYAETQQLELDDYLHLLELHRLVDRHGQDEPYRSYEQREENDEDGEGVVTHLYIVGPLPAPRHLSPTSELWVLLEEYHDGCFWIEKPYPTEQAAKVAADAIADELDGTQLC